MVRCGRMLTACATVLYLLAFHGSPATSVDVDRDLTAACRRLCDNRDRDSTDQGSVDRCPVDCQRMIRLTPKDRIQTQNKLPEDGEEDFSRSSRIWLLPDISQWQARMQKSGIGSRSRSAGAYLRIGRRNWPSVGSSADGFFDVERRRGRFRGAGRYLRIGRASETANQGQVAPDVGHDGEDPIDLLHLRKVNRDVAVKQDTMQ